MKKEVNKFLKIVLLIAMVFSDFMTPISVLAEALDNNAETIEKGAIRLDGQISNKGSVTVTEGTLTNGGDVQVTKTVSKTDTLGKYKVELEVKGKDIQDEIEITKPLYLVIAFDTSNSMICGDGYVDTTISGTPHYVMQDGTAIKCDNGYSYNANLLTKDKWENAVNGAVAFSETLVNMKETYVSLVTFGGTASDATDFKHEALTASQFHYNTSGTNIKAGIEKAQAKLDTVTDKNVQKYIVLIGDGIPTSGGSGWGSDKHEIAAKNAANNAKAAGIKIFSIGYDIANNQEAQEILKNISSNYNHTENKYEDLGYYKDAHQSGTDGIAGVLQTTFKELGELKKAGTNATLTDKVGNGFKIVGQDGNTFTSEVIKEITQLGNKFTFYIEIDQDNPTGWYKTNDGFKLVYTDIEGKEKTISSSMDPEVYWRNPKFENESIEKTTTNKEITTSNTKVSYTLNYNVNITDVEANSNVVTTIVDTLPYQIDESKSNLNGGTYNNANKTITWTISTTTTEFTKNININKEIQYSVVYKDYANISVQENNNLTNTVVGKTVIGTQKSTGVSDNASIPVNIKGSLEVIYVAEDGTVLEGPTTTTKPVGTAYETEQKTFYGYTFKSVEGQKNGEYVEGTTKVKYTYTKNEGKVTTNNVTKEGPTTIDSIDKTFDYVLTYEGVIEEYVGEVTLELTDKLPNSVKEVVSKDDRCTFNAETNTMTCTATYEIDEDNKEINDSFNISVTFNDITTNTVTNEVTSVLKFENKEFEDESSVTTKVKEGSLEVIYVAEDGTVLEGPTTTTKPAGTAYETEQKTFYGYTFKSIEGQKNGEYVEGTTKVKYTYTKNEGKVTTNDVTKEGPKTIDTINDTFDYVLKYNGVIKEYVGEVTLELTDTLPNKVKEVVSKDDRCTFNVETNTMTCTATYEVNEENTKINDSFKISVTFDDITTNSITNKVTSVLTYGENKVEDGGETTTEIKEGSLEVIYVAEDGTVLEGPITTTKPAGTAYETEQKTFYGYTFKSVEGQKNGEYVEGTTKVKYTYTKNEGKVTTNDVTKEGQKIVDTINDTFDYVLKYNGVIEEYVGEVTLELTDTLPNKVKEVVSKDNRCTFDKETNTMTCTSTYEIDEDNKEINDSFTISVTFDNITTNTVTNEVTSVLTYGKKEVENESSVTTQIKDGVLEVIYVSTDGTVLEAPIITTELAGTAYETEQKLFYGYTFKELIGEKSGEYLPNSTITVKYVYTKNDGKVTINDVTKEGPTTIDSIDKTFDYVLKYNGVIEEYVGEVTLELTDTLPNKVKEVVSKDNRCTFDKVTNTITCTEEYDIKDGSREIEDLFTISVTFDDITTNAITNKVTSVLTYGDKKVEDNGETTTTIKEGSLEVIYVTEDGTVLEGPATTTKPAGTAYETEQKTFYGYTFEKVEGETSGEYLPNSTVTVKYTYSKNEGKITTNDVTKEGPTTIDSIDKTFDYVLKYNGVIEEYVGEVTLELTDTLPNKVKEVVSKDNRCTFNKETNTIICTSTYEIDEDNKEINDSFNISVKYTDIITNTVTNEVTTVLTYGKKEAENKASVTTKVKEGSLEVIYVAEDGTVLEGPTTTTKPVGTAYETEQKTFYGYTFKSVEGQKNGKYVERTTKVKYTYTKNEGKVTTNDVTKEGPTTIDSIDKTFDYVLKYNGVIEEYVGEVTLELTDTLPNKVKEVVSKDNRCTFNKETNTMTCTATYEIDEENTKVTDSFTISVTFDDITTNSITNKVTSVLIYGENKVEDGGETTTEIKEGSLEVIYVSTDGTVLEGQITTTKPAGTAYETEQKTFYGYTFEKVEGETSGEYLPNSTVTVKYTYSKNEGKITTNDVTKEGTEIVGSINDTFDYILKYEGIIEEYTGKITLELTDRLPNAIKEIVSMDNRCTYDAETNTITCTATYEIDEENTKVTDSFNISVKYENILNNKVTNEVISKLKYGEKEVEDESSTTTEVKTGDVLIHYAMKIEDTYIPLNIYAKDENGNVLPDFENIDIEDLTLTGMIDEGFETIFKEITGHKFNGLYTGNLVADSSNLNKIEGTTTTGTFTEETQEFTYVYDVEMGSGGDVPPQTGVEAPINNTITYINYLLILLIVIVLKKRI